MDAAANLSKRTDRRTDVVADSPKALVEAQYSLCSNTIIDSLQVTGAKGDLCPGSFMSTGANAPVALVAYFHSPVEFRTRTQSEACDWSRTV